MDEQNTGEQSPQPGSANRAAKWVIGIIVVALIIGALAWHSKKESSVTERSNTVASDTITIGAILPMTGDAAAYGQPGMNTMELAAEEINNAGGINGKKLSIIYEDGKCDGQDATNAMQKLVNVDKVQVVIGGFCSSESLAAEAVGTPSKVLLFSPGSTSPKLTDSSPFFFRIVPSDNSQASLDAQIAHQRGYKTVAIIQEETDYAVGLNDAFAQAFQQLGGKTTTESFPTGSTDFKTDLTKLKAQTPDALFIDTQTPANTDTILKQLQQLGWKPQLFIDEATAGDSKTIAADKDLLEGAVGAQFATDPTNTKFQHLLQAYKSKYGIDLDFQSYGQTEYDAVYLITDGLKAVGNDGQKLADWSRTIKDWQGASGSITIQPDGDRTNGYTSEIVKDGVMVPYQQ